MRVAIIGAGWFGCHIGTKLLEKGVSVDIFEEKDKIFSGASGYNQNRLHLGFHYPRSWITRKQSKEGFEKFVKEYPSLSEKVENNIYGIAEKGSYLDFDTYLHIMDYSGLDYKLQDPKKLGLVDIEGCISCGERLIKTNEARKYFENSRLSRFIHLRTKVETVEKQDKSILVNGEKFDFVIDCTGQKFYNNSNWDILYEACLVLLYEGNKNHSAITVMDGQFFTIYPYEDNLYTVYSVQYSPLSTPTGIGWVKGRLDYLSENQVEYQRGKFETCVLYNYPSFLDQFKYVGYYKSIRTKRADSTDSRKCEVSEQDKVIQVLAGKVDHIFYAWEETWKHIQKYC